MCWKTYGQGTPAWEAFADEAEKAIYNWLSFYSWQNFLKYKDNE
jgi:hypothetical protein